MKEVTSNPNYDDQFHCLSALATVLRRRTEHPASRSLWETGAVPGAERAPDSKACAETHSATGSCGGVTNPSVSPHLLYNYDLER